MILKGGDTRLKKAASTIAAMKPNQFNNGAVGGQYFLFLIFLISSLSRLFFWTFVWLLFFPLFYRHSKCSWGCIIYKPMVPKLLHVSYHYFHSQRVTYFYFFFLISAYFFWIPPSLFRYLSLSIYVSIHLFIYLFPSLSHTLSLYLSLFLSLYLFLSLSLPLSLPLILSLYFSPFPSLFLSFCVSLSSTASHTHSPTLSLTLSASLFYFTILL